MYLNDVGMSVRMCYNIITPKERGVNNEQEKKKRKPQNKSGNQRTTSKIVLITAFLNLLIALINLIDKLTE